MRYGKSMSEALAEIREGFSKKQIKMAIGIASDPRYKQGNYSGAYKQIEKIKKGLADHPQVAAVLKRQNEEILEKVKCPDCEGEGCPKCEGNGYMADAVDKEDEPFLKDLIKNLRKGSATHGKQADDLEKAVKEEVELDEGKMSPHEEKISKAFKTKNPVEIKGIDKLIDISNMADVQSMQKRNPKEFKNTVMRLGESVELTEALKPKDKKTVDAFYKGEFMNGFALISDGKKLYSTTQTIATKEGSKFKIVAKMDGRFTQSVVNYIKKTFPKNVVSEEVELDEIKEPFVVIDTADGNKVVGTASSEKGAKEIITTAQLPPMKIKDKKTLLIVGPVKKKQMIGYPLKEGTWHIPDTPKLKSGLKKIMSKPIKLGKEGDDAVDVIGKFIGDDELYDDLYTAGKKNPNGDARDVIKKAMKRLGIKEEVELDEGKMKAVAMKIDSIVAKMKKNKEMKSFADKFKKEASKTLDIAKSLEKVLPDYIAGKDIAALVKEETVVESWELDEMKMDDPKLLKIFDKLKKGSTVKIKIDSSISKGKDYREFTVTAKNIVGKGKKFEQEKITLKSKDNPTGVKHFLYNRDGKVTLAIGDMGASIADIKEDNMSAYTAAITKGVK